MPLTRRVALTRLLTAAAAFVPIARAVAEPFVLHPELAPRDPPARPAGLVVGEHLPPWQRNAVQVTADDPRPKIAVVIDDMGFTHPYTERAMALPGPLTLSWFPFARSLPEQVAAAAARGHEAMLHMPMQSFSNTLAQTGPDPLRIDLPPAVNTARLRAALAAVPNIVGLNNHMGCIATRDPALMDIVAAEARDHGMLFLDSVTIPHSVALERAEMAGVPAAARDVFIDNVARTGVIGAQLASIEAFARHYGYAIAIGHPRQHTLDALEAWLPTLTGKGFVLWPIAATVALRNRLDLPQRA
jgi:polysaccharide deacetylase 2 family uncharacterized protein YibQ